MNAVRRLPLFALLSALAGCATAPGTAPSSSPDRLSEIRALEAESAARLAAEGELLFFADRERKESYQFCGNAMLLLEQGELRRGIREASKALFLGQRNGDAYLLAFATRDLAYAYSLAGNLERAEQFAGDSLGHLQRAPAAASRGPVLSFVHKVRGDVRLRQGRAAEAVTEYEQALAASDPRFKLFVHASLASAYLARKEHARAREHLAAADATAGPTLKAMVRRGLGQLALAEGRPQEAARLFTEAAAAATGLDQAYHRFWSLEGVARAEQAAGNRAAALEAYRRAMAAAEEVRGRFRSEEFKTGFFGDMQHVFDEAVAQLMQAGRGEEALEASERSRARALLDMVRGRVTASAGAEAFADPLGRPASGAQIRAMLPPGTAIVEYHVLPRSTHAWVIRRSGIRALTIADGRPALEPAVERLRAAIRARSHDALDAAADLHRRVVAPLGLEAGETMVVVPHDVLHYVPFHALRGGTRYLVEERAVSYAPSASAAATLLVREARARQQVVALGNPDVGAARLALPGAQREVERIKALYPQAEVYVQKEATKERVVTRAAQSEVLHVAAHAEVDRVDPLHSVIRLARTATGSGELEAHEVYRLNLARSPMVALSACETGLGRVSRGDELWGFTRSFLSAGAPTVIVSLWPVEDESTGRLMGRLYEDLRGGAATRAALRSGQLEVLRDERTAHPFFWAPFILVGDWR